MSDTTNTSSERWTDTVDLVRPYVFRISTPGGRGTGFQLFCSKNLCGIATALHVIQHADDWEEPIRLTQHNSGDTCLLRPSDRAVFIYPNRDLAFLVFNPKEFKLENKQVNIIPPNKRLRQGVSIGWCGFPSVSPNDLCFFSGHVSSWIAREEAYLIDGVAINGVSGGPAFSAEPVLCGVVSAYIPNRATGETLPGVCLIRDVAPYQERLKELESLEEAQDESESESDKEGHIE